MADLDKYNFKTEKEMSSFLRINGYKQTHDKLINVFITVEEDDVNEPYQIDCLTDKTRIKLSV